MQHVTSDHEMCVLFATQNICRFFRENTKGNSYSNAINASTLPSQCLQETCHQTIEITLDFISILLPFVFKINIQLHLMCIR